MISIKEKIEISVDENLCDRCDACAEVCPSGVFSWRADNIDVHNPGRCIGCGHCVAVCKSAALKHSLLSANDFMKIDDGEPMNRENVRRLFVERRSVRRFKNTLMDRDLVECFIDTARYAPTSTNSQNVRFMVFHGQDKVSVVANETSEYYLKLGRQLANPLIRFGIGLTVGFKTVNAYRFRMPAIVEMFEKTLQGDDRLFYDAPCVVVLFASGLPHLATASCNLAAMELMLSAESEGLGTCFNGYALTAMVRDKKVKEALNVPKGYTPGAVIAIGEPAGKFYRTPPRKKRRVIWA